MDNKLSSKIGPNSQKKITNSNSLVGVSLSILAFVVFFVVLIIPLVSSFLLSFKEYSPFNGMSGSPWVGMSNFASIFNSPQLGKIIGNTVIISLLGTLLGAVYVFIMTYAISRIQNKWCKIITVAVVVLPAFIPLISVMNMMMRYAKGIFITSSLYVLAPMFNEILTTASVVILFGAFVTMKNSSSKAVLFVTLSYVALKLLTFFSPDHEFIRATYNPLVYESADVLDTFIYRSGLMQMQISQGSAAFIIKIMLQLIPTIVAIVLFMMLPKLASHHNTDKNNADNDKTIMGLVLIIPLFITTLILISGFTGSQWGTSSLLQSLFITLIISILSCFAFIVLIFMLGYGFSTNNKVVIILTLTMTLFTNNVVGEYLFMRSAGVINTVFAVMISNLPYCIFGAIMLYIALSSRNINSFRDYTLFSIGPIIALMGIGFSSFYGNINSSINYISDISKLPVSALIMRGMGQGEGLPLVSVLAIIPILVGLTTTVIGLLVYHNTLNLEKAYD